MKSKSDSSGNNNVRQRVAVIVKVPILIKVRASTEMLATNQVPFLILVLAGW